ncbi:hypothetical protein GH714_027759 [Hevea brasiliensis]|uniref:RRM domain-containing protein n=1 Tax=Hevea brasiliensis TaxID=3981 RepID=A0A6A6KUL1_HEVBR|nr:hypothetical protein GH714_027759 [Hevea brasiliensis]
MNPLTLVKRIQNINSKEAELGISEDASWHAKYKDSAYVFVGDMGIVDVNLVRDKDTGKSKGFAFIAYEDQRSTNLAVDNLNGAEVAGRIVRVDHVTKYKKKEEDEETEQHNSRRERLEEYAVLSKERAANTGWGPEDKSPRWGHDKFDAPKKSEKRSGNERPSESLPKQSDRREDKSSRRHDENEMERKSKEDYHRRDGKRWRRHEDNEFEPKSSEDYDRRDEKRSRRHGDEEFEPKTRDDYHRSDEKRLRRHEDVQRGEDYKRDERGLRRHNNGDGLEPRSRDNDDRREEKRFKRHESESYLREDQDKRGAKSSAHVRDSSSSRRRERDEHRRKSER